MALAGPSLQRDGIVQRMPPAAFRPFAGTGGVVCAPAFEQRVMKPMAMATFGTVDQLMDLLDAGPGPRSGILTGCRRRSLTVHRSLTAVKDGGKTLDHTNLVVIAGTCTEVGPPYARWRLPATGPCVDPVPESGTLGPRPRGLRYRRRSPDCKPRVSSLARNPLFRVVCGHRL